VERERPRPAVLVRPEQPRQSQGQQAFVGWGRPRRPTVTRQSVSAVPFELVRDDQIRIGGRLRHFADFWRRLSNSRTVIQTVLGAKIPFSSEPCQESLPEPYRLSKEDEKLV
jgi:hypothetical protein